MFADYIKAYLAKIRTINIFLALFFVVSGIVGYAIAQIFPNQVEEYLLKDLEKMISPAKNLSGIGLFEFIFLKNLITASISVFLGFIFGFVPILVVFANGLTIGVVSYIFLKQFDFIILLAGIAPHGIIEIPALIFSAASGIWLWHAIIRRLLHDEKNLGNESKSIVIFFGAVIAPMLFVAALIEAFITPYVISLVRSLFM